MANESLKVRENKMEFTILPTLSTFRVNTKRTYGFGDYGMIPTPGAQLYLAGGVHYQWKELGITFYPDLVYAQNAAFNGFQGLGNTSWDRTRFLYWNFGDNPERFGSNSYSQVSLGQSRISYGFGAFELAVANQNLWIGPGQFNALTFSNNTPGFPMASIGTRRPAKTFLGNFEVHLFSGILNTTRREPTQSDSLNALYFRTPREKNRYVNGLTVSYNPKWIKGFYFGANRTVQTFTDSIGSGFIDILPVFWGVTKQSVGSDLIGESDKGRSQLITIFGRYIHQPSRFELYFEFGRRDHALNWREFIISPEHARAYIFGFNKLIRIEELDSDLLIRGEITHQQESVNRYIRYPGLTGGVSWHMNGSIGGLTHHGQPTGVGIGTGSNIQTFEISKINGMNKTGLFFERLDNNVDFFYRALLQFTERKPWVDLSLGFLYDKQFGNLLLSSKLQLIHARNYQWQLDPASTPDFPKGKNLTSVMGQVSAVYFWNKEN
ncbi:MAG: capsule assembly Wzi family protein [Bacteroidota bacterium]